LAPLRQAEELSSLIYRHYGFRGNEEDFEDPKNSLVDQVLSRRLGIPISLALIYCEVARRIGVTAVGVGFPEHFLVRVVDKARVAGVDRSVLVDPFHSGQVLDEDTLSNLAERVSGQRDVDPAWVEPSSLPAILTRTLNNLRLSYSRRGDHAQHLVVLSRLCELEPRSPIYIRERGLAQAKLGAPRAAIADLEQYLDWAPQASDVQTIAEFVDELYQRLQRARATDRPN
jgi:regulator of sirC expression with transglutaminase-like and TPR domain